MSNTKPTAEDVEEFVLSCRYGELEEVQQFSDKFGWDAVVDAKDDRGNTGLHMCCANGHVGKSPPTYLRGGTDHM